MKRALAGVIMLAALPSAAQAADACGPLKIINQVQMTRLAGSNLDLVPLTINGAEKHFLFDTGGSLTQIGQAAAQSLNLIVAPGNVEMYDMRGRISDSMASVPKFVLGHQRGARAFFPVTPNLDATNPDPFDGIFALDYISRYDAEMDFGTDMLNVFSPDHCPGHVVYWAAPAVAVIPFILKNQHIIVPVMLDGQELDALIDSGSDRTSMRVDIAETRYGLKLGSADAPENGALNGDATLKTYGHAFGTLTFGNVAIDNPHVTVIPNIMGATSDHWRQVAKPYQMDMVNTPQLIIGMDVLRKLRIYMAFGEGKLYISPASPAARQAGDGS